MFCFNKIGMKYYILLISVIALFLMGCASSGVQSVPTDDWGISSQDNENLKSSSVLTRDTNSIKETGRLNRIDVAKRRHYILAKRKKLSALRRPINDEDLEAKIQGAIDSGDITNEQAEEKRAAIEKRSAIWDEKGGRKPMDDVKKGGRKPMDDVKKGWRKPMDDVKKGWRKPMDDVKKGGRKPMDDVKKGWRKPMDDVKKGGRKPMDDVKKGWRKPMQKATSPRK